VKHLFKHCHAPELKNTRPLFGSLIKQHSVAPPKNPRNEPNYHLYTPTATKKDVTTKCFSHDQHIQAVADDVSSVSKLAKTSLIFIDPRVRSMGQLSQCAAVTTVDACRNSISAAFFLL